MRILTFADSAKKGLDAEYVYNGYDSTVTLELFEVMKRELVEPYASVYNFERLLLGPVMTMIRRGIKVDQDMRLDCVRELRERMTNLGGMGKAPKKYKRPPKGDPKIEWQLVNPAAPLQQLAGVFGFDTFNYQSDRQLKDLFYQQLQCKEVTKWDKGDEKVTIDKKALAHLADAYIRAMPLANIILRLNDLKKELEVFEADVSEDHRWRFSLNIGGTVTGRFSSSKYPILKTGGNSQNIEKGLRRAFIPDAGMTMWQADLKGADAVVVAYLSGSKNYLEAVESGIDIYAMMCKRMWNRAPIRAEKGKSVEGTVDELFADKKTYRDVMKTLRHARNYLGKAAKLAQILGCSVSEAEDFLRADKKIYPEIDEWHVCTAEQLQKHGYLDTPWGFRRHFWDRLWDDSTLREAVAHIPQSTVAHTIDVGIYRVWYDLEPEVQILNQIHDAAFGQCYSDKITTAEEKVIPLLENPLPVTDIHGVTRTMTLKPSWAIGSNWKECS